MPDSLHSDMFAGIPELGMRLTALVLVGLAVAIAILLVYFRMKDLDEGAGL